MTAQGQAGIPHGVDVITTSRAAPPRPRDIAWRAMYTCLFMARRDD